MKVVVIGGGPAGIMCSGISSANGNEVILIEKMNRLGKKLLITGKGRCNITNASDITDFFDYIPRNSTFMYSSLYQYTNQNLIEFFESNGLKLKEERGKRIFPVSDNAGDVVKILEKFLHKNNVKIMLNTSVTKIITDENMVKGIEISNSDNSKTIVLCDKVVIATGGKSYPLTGSTGDGYELAKALGHNIIKPEPSLVPLITKENWVKELQGVSLKNVDIKIKQDNKIIYQDFGEMIFTHFGVSGPIILSGSAHIKNSKKGNIKIIIDLKPALDEEILDLRIQKDFEKYINKSFKNALDDLLPQKLIPVIIKLAHIDEEKKVHQITKEERKSLINVIKNLELTFVDFRPIEEAIITSGGIDVSEINPSTMESKIVKGLYFAGEVIDVDAYTGGFNLQVAFSTRLACRSELKSCKL